MIKKYLFALAFAVSLLGYAQTAAAQNNVTAVVSNANNVEFKIERPLYKIMLSQHGLITGYIIKATGKVSFDTRGRLEQIGKVKVSYDLQNRLSEIGNDPIMYNLDGKVTSIGRTQITYTIHHDKIDTIQD
ncbi:hypothetical protein [Rufibacter roseus]|uniref:DUF3108 domain-containing protein n=1 Tax=Rufibacter roseus TaxID=1567108 RepID=A0ABW2DPV7_9BACT|nr:hypothetical protein [Rufibacter roseus]